VHNPAFAEGMAGSLKVGVAQVGLEIDGVLVLLGDMPLVTPSVIARLVQVFAAEPQAKAVVPVADGRRANPVLLSRALFPAVAGLSGDTGARALLDAAGDDVVEVPIDEDAVLIDIDTPEALAHARRASDR
jgi:molybdenum cofactor cytidylyltransferase